MLKMLPIEYKEHEIFKQLTDYSSFYESLSFNVMSFVTPGTQAIINLDTYLYSSIRGTLESMKTILENGRINDAYALLRKYHESVAINAYVMVFIEENIDTDNYFKNKINYWLQGKESLPEYGPMMQTIRNYKRLDVINHLLHGENKYKKLRDRCNNHLHYNFFDNVLLNDNEIYNDKRVSVLNVLSQDIKDVFILHFIYTFTLSGHYMASSDYLDYLEMGQTPPEDSQFWVAPFVQDIFDSVIKPNRPDLAKELIQSTSMFLK